MFNAFDLAKFYRQSSSVRRYSTINLAKDENIAEHSMHVAFLCYTIGKKVKEKFSSVVINLENCCTLSIFHDLDELITGDIPRATKYHNEEIHKSVESLANFAQKRISDIFDLDLSLLNYKESATDDEKYLIKSCDFLSVILKIYWELESGNLDAKDMIPEITGYASELSKKSLVSQYVYDNYMVQIFDEFKKFSAHEKLNFRVL